MRIAMGLDGGGTKTDCVLMDEAGRILGRGRGGASNPSRIGADAARIGVLTAARAALREAGKQTQNVTDLCAGLAGVGRPENAERMSEELREIFSAAKIEVCTDLDLALDAAGSRAAIALVAGTGSAAIGRDASGRVARAGGYGPKKSDEGSAFAVGKSAVEAVQSAIVEGARDLRDRILDQLSVDTLDKVAGLRGEEADAVYPRVFPVVANAADEGNEIARKLLSDAAKSLAELVAGVQEELKLGATEFVLGKTGGMIERSTYFEEILDVELQRIAPQAKPEILRTPLAEVAARRALRL
jgi:N-acetylglucosamine kinase-like BadF-type ATPase